MKRFFASLLLSTLVLTSVAQDKTDSTRWTLSKYIQYWGVDTRISEGDLNKLVQWLDSAENQTLSQNVRQDSYQKMYALLAEKFQDADSTQLKQMVPQYARMSMFNNIKLSWITEPKKMTPDNYLPSIKKIGTGSLAVIAIAAPSYDGREFEKIIEAFDEMCTFWVITLPGAGGIPPYKLPAKKDIASHAWLSNVVSGIAELVRKEKMKTFFLLTHGSSLAITMLLAQSPLHARVRGAASINSGITEVRYSKTDPSKTETAEERRYRLNHRFPIGDFTRGNFALGTTFSNKEAYDMKMVRAHFKALNALTSSYVSQRYQEETSAVDINGNLSKLTFPLLVLNPLYDPGVAGSLITNNRQRQATWQKAKAEGQKIPLYLSTIEARDFFLFKNSDEINRQLFSFINRDYSLFTERRPTVPVLASPSAVISQTFSNTDITIRYSRPAVRDRTTFGTLIPYGKVWRAGANQGTEIILTRDVKVNGAVLKSGRYTLFVIPEETKWTFIFNKLVDQWGTSQYSEKYDALRVDVNVETIGKQEWMTYNFENMTDTSVSLTLSWDTKKAGIVIEEVFTKPIASKRIVDLPWKTILTDTINDHSNKGRPDGKALSYYHDEKSDSLWFRFETHSGISQSSPAISLSLDTDNDQTTGVAWYGSNRTFKVDLMASVGVTREGAGYAGFNGITDAQGIKTSDWINVKDGCLRFYFDEKGQAFYVGMKKSDVIKPNQKRVNLIGSVGASATWNDDIGKDGTFATILFD